MKIIIENSTWNNMGDAFYQSSLFSLFKNIFPNDEVFMGEGPFKRSFRPRSKWQLDNGFKLMDFQWGDIHVFSGPMVKFLIRDYGDKIEQIKKRGGNYMLVSASAAHISEAGRLETGRFLEKFPPLIFSTRDVETYENFKSFDINTYNGICAAFMVESMLPVLDFSSELPFFVSSFYTELEPIYNVKGEVNIENIKIIRKKGYFKLRHRYSRHLGFLRPRQSEISTHKIVRVRQDFGTHFKHIKYAHPNSFMSFNPLSYLSVYKSADFTISDRVHSCAVSLVFGKPAMLLIDSPRAGIFDRIGYKFSEDGRTIYPIDNKIIDTEIEKMSKAILEACSVYGTVH